MMDAFVQQSGEPLHMHPIPDEVPGEERPRNHEPIANDAEERAAGRHASYALGIGEAHLQPDVVGH